MQYPLNYGPGMPISLKCEIGKGMMVKLAFPGDRQGTIPSLEHLQIKQQKNVMLQPGLAPCKHLN